jgi:hypothetical protein
MIDRKYTGSSAGGNFDFPAARRFLTLIDPAETSWIFQTWDDCKDKSTPKRPGLISQPHADCNNLPVVLEELARKNAAGAAVAVTINKTDGAGRTGSNIVGIRALFVDLDGGPLPPVSAYKARRPHIVVESSPGRFHLYWLVTGIAVENFSAYQNALIDRFGGDASVNTRERAMRVPGFYHHKREPPFLIRILAVNERPPYPATAFDKKPQPIRTPNTSNDVLVNPAFVRKVMSYVLPSVDFDKRVRVGLAIHRSTGGSAEGCAIWFDWLARSGPTKWSRIVAQRRWLGFRPHSIGFGSIFHWATEDTPDWGDQLDIELMDALRRAAREWREE